MRHTVLVLAALVCVGCRGAADALLPRERPIRELAYAGDRPDAPPLEQRGNAAFESAAFDDDGRFLVTVPFFPGQPGLNVFDARTGELVSRPDVGIPNTQKEVWMIDGKRGRLLGQKHPETGFRLVDLRTGAGIAQIPGEPNDRHPAVAGGLVGDGSEVLLFKPGWLEVWQLDPPRLARRAASPLPEDKYFPTGVGGIPATYNDKMFWEWSPDRSALAMAITPVFSPMSESHFYLVDAVTLAITELTMPSERASRTLTSFAFSPDNRWLAIGTDSELLLYDRTNAAWGATIPGDQRRSPRLGAMRFTPDSARIIALGDQLQVSVYDVATGARIGRHEPEFENWEGVFEAARDGSRIVVYKFVSDTFEVFDGRDAKRLGFVCPYFCNAKHNPNQPPYALSPDGTRAAISHRRGTAIWDTGTDQIIVPLRDPAKKPLPYPYQR